MEHKTFEVKKHLADCYVLCNYCFNACLKEDDVKMLAKCIKLDKECGEICGVALSLVASDSEFKKEIVNFCIKACEACAAECRKHNHEHCRECAQSCEKCAEACRAYLQ